MALKTHFLIYAAFALLSIIFVIAAYSSKYDWANTSWDIFVANTCYKNVDVDTGLFKKKYSVTYSGCNLTPYSDEDELDCENDTDDNSAGCYALHTSQNAARASISFAVVKFVSVLWPLHLVWKGDEGISLTQLKSAGLCQLIISFILMICCFTTTGRYRDFLFEETSVNIEGVIYSISWNLGSSWYLMLFAGLFNIGMMIYSITLLFHANRAGSSDRPQVFATAVVIQPPPTVQTTINPVGPGAYVPPHTQPATQTVVTGRVLREDGANNVNEV